MIKQIACVTILIFCVKLSYAQKPLNDLSVRQMYASPVGQIVNNDSLHYYLVKLKQPEGGSAGNARLIKRISYNYFIVSSRKAVALSGNILSVAPSNSLWKADDNLAWLNQTHPNETKVIDIVLKQQSDGTLNKLKQYGDIISVTGNTVQLKLKLKQLPALLQSDEVSFASARRKAHPELVINDIDLGSNNISAVAGSYAGITGSGVNVSVKEERYDEEDLDLLGRSFNSVSPADNTSGHATIMATLIGGNGNSFIKGLGAAPQVRLTSSNFAMLLPDTITAFKSNNISVQNHSYGTAIENYYGIEAQAYDKQVYQDSSIIHVFSSGNIGTTSPATGVYSGVANAANLSGTFKQAKNVLVIGGTGNTDVPEALSSAGPAYDGRIKPDIVAAGEDGTSGAAALTSGTVALMQQAYKQQSNSLPSSALIKSILMNSADDIGTPNVDYKTGYGKLNALEAVRTITDKRFNSGVVNQGGQISYPLIVPANCKELKVSLAWNDAPAQLNAPYALVNDLDLSIRTPGGATLLPWTLSIFPSADSILKPAVRRRDTLNNTEQVTLQNPPAGTYTIYVKGQRVTQGLQPFCIAWHTRLANQFEWTSPVVNNQLLANSDNYMRWQSSFVNLKGDISISYNHGSTWQQLATGITLSTGSYKFAAPDVFTSAIVKMHTGNSDFVSSEFTISRPLSLQVGYNCTTGTLLHWNAQPGATGYQIYTLKDNLLQKLRITTDTTILISAATQTSNYYAVSAIGSGFEGVKSYTINATTQGVGCYVRALLAEVKDNSTIGLSLDIGSTNNLKAITWQKLVGTNLYKDLATTNVNDAILSYHFTDSSPKKGINYYRVALKTRDNLVSYSDLASAVILKSNQFTVYPNPVASRLTILAGEANNYDLTFYDAMGRPSYTTSFNGLENTVQLSLTPGTYIAVISLKGKVMYSDKIIKQP
jgi:hypothetical protein